MTKAKLPSFVFPDDTPTEFDLWLDQLEEKFERITGKAEDFTGWDREHLDEIEKKLDAGENPLLEDEDEDEDEDDFASPMREPRGDWRTDDERVAGIPITFFD